MKNTRAIAILSALACVTLFVAGCQKSTGGGWISTTTGKATFGFQSQCNNVGYPVGQVPPDLYVGEISGQFQYKDRSEGVAFHGVMDIIPFEVDNEFTSCEVIDYILAAEGIPNTFLMAGTYTPVPKTAGPGGIVEVLVVDAQAGGPSCDGGDGIAIGIIGGIYDGYYSEACLEGGNIVVHQE